MRWPAPGCHCNAAQLCDAVPYHMWKYTLETPAVQAAHAQLRFKPVWQDTDGRCMHISLLIPYHIYTGVVDHDNWNQPVSFV